ncbi:MAG TPA: hypothetical protein VGH38_33165 [Bryobacteraceae bacterium]
MRRRTLIQSALWLATARVAVVLPFSGIRAWAQTAAFPGSREKVLKDLAATVLPESLGRAGTDAIAGQFVRWVREYRPGADMSPGYGFPRVRKKAPSPAAGYLAQLDQLAAGALAQSDVPGRRRLLAESIQAAKIPDLPQIPDGTHIAVDLMSFYFQSSEANDLAYGAAIGRDKCRTLTDSGSVPKPLGGANRAAL